MFLDQILDDFYGFFFFFFRADYIYTMCFRAQVNTENIRLKTRGKS